MPSNYLQELDDDALADGAAAATAAESEPAATTQASAPEPEAEGATATALYDYEAGEDNELSFPENAVITNIVSRSLIHLSMKILIDCTELP